MLAVGMQERFESVAIFNASGELIASRPVADRRQVGGESWFKATVANNGTPIIHRPYISSLTGDPVAVLTYPVHDESGLLRAVVVGALALKQDELWTASPGAGMQGETSFILLTDDRYIAMHPDSAFITKPLSALGDAGAMIVQGLADP